jgi:hypothetical protein
VGFKEYLEILPDFISNKTDDDDKNQLHNNINNVKQLQIEENFVFNLSDVNYKLLLYIYLFSIM